MDHWFASILTETQLSSESLDALRTNGFAVVPGPVATEQLAELILCYDEAVSQALPEDVRVGSTTTRVSDFVNRDAQFDSIYLYPLLLEACCRVIEQPFKLSTMLARTLRPHMPAQQLHVDFPGDAQGWPMIGFILMIDEFTPENGATCFVPGSQGMRVLPEVATSMPACGAAGSMIVYNGSVWHGHGANRTGSLRRSIQGAYIRRTEASGANLAACMRPKTLDRIGELAKYLLAV